MKRLPAQLRDKMLHHLMPDADNRVHLKSTGSLMPGRRVQPQPSEHVRV